ncbi:MAG: DUF5132 domain-containing protein [Anaerolineae bacterium]|nr:DUF5132 domain-containing protein [Anaerolineae bacterium]
MEPILAAIVGAGVVAASPFVPALRPVAKTIVATGLTVTDKAKTAVAITGEHWLDIVAEAQVEREAEAEARANAVETITIPLEE